MKLICLGSSSKGNGYILDNGKEALVLEAGVPFHKVEMMVGYGTNRIKACLCSHIHGDHAGHVDEFVRNHIPCYGSKDMAVVNRRVKAYGNQPMKIGGFTVLAFEVEHDVECYGFYIYHEDMGFLLFCTDTAFIRQRFSSLHHVMIECNYDYDILAMKYMAGIITKAQRDRTMLSHMSLQTCIETINVQPSKHGIIDVILLHLSDNNSDEVKFKNEVAKETGKLTFVANEGMKFELKDKPF